MFKKITLKLSTLATARYCYRRPLHITSRVHIKMKLIIDADPGVDDATALGMVLSRDKSEFDIMGITCVNGNVDVDKTTTNALKILEAFDRKDVPVFKGATTPILACEHTGAYWHGVDGMADVYQDTPDQTPLQKEHAVSAINRLVSENKGEVTVVALGPLTNLALALRLNPSLAHDMKELIIMGGNYKGEGNVSMAAEFNFFIDPIAAHIVLEDIKCPKYLVTWELSKHPYLSLEQYKEYSFRGNKKANFFKTIFEAKNTYETLPGICDAVAMGVALDKNIIRKQHDVYGTVVTDGTQAKGLVLIDWNPEFRQIGGKKENNLIIVDEIDVERYTKMVVESTL